MGDHLPPRLDFRTHMPHIRSQFPHGTCAAFSVVDALAFSAGTQGVPLSVRWLYSQRERKRGANAMERFNNVVQGEGG